MDIGAGIAPWFGDIAEDLGEAEIPSGVQGQSPSKRSGGRNLSEAEAISN